MSSKNKVFFVYIFLCFALMALVVGLPFLKFENNSEPQVNFQSVSELTFNNKDQAENDLSPDTEY